MSENKSSKHYELYGYKVKSFPYEVEIKEFQYFVPDEQLVDEKVMYVDRLYQTIETFVELDDAFQFANKVLELYNDDIDLRKMFDFEVNITDVFNDNLVASTHLTNITSIV